MVYIILCLDLTQNWELRMHSFSHLYEDAFMTQAPGFTNSNMPFHMCKLRKSLYEFKQAPRPCYHELRDYLLLGSRTHNLIVLCLSTRQSHSELIYD